MAVDSVVRDVAAAVFLFAVEERLVAGGGVFCWGLTTDRLFSEAPAQEHDPAAELTRKVDQAFFDPFADAAVRVDLLDHAFDFLDEARDRRVLLQRLPQLGGARRA